VTAATFRLPGPLAIQVAQVDRMSGGRVELGLGTGWYEAEHSAYGIAFPPLAERFARLDEQLAIVTGLWKSPLGARFSFEGKHYRLDDSPALPKPAQDPHPPVIVGGIGRARTPRLAAGYASEYNAPFVTPDVAGPQYERVRKACEAAGRDPATMTFSATQVLCCGVDEAEVSRRAAAIGREAGELRESGLAGTPDQVVSKLGRFAELGATRVYLQVLDLDDLDHLALVAKEVLPRVT
jgi:alkanesulfonate monooxygenase SsuD/methylene tetrahydromethanopterin reductase-like flavin-dependent oxidoreductase (luciferase family)